MKLLVTKLDGTARTVEGVEARHELRTLFQAISNSLLIPEMPHTGKVRCRIKQRLRSGAHVWSYPDGNGQPSPRSVILSMPVELLGVIDADGTFRPVGGGS